MDNKDLIIAQERVNTLLEIISGVNKSNAIHTINNENKIIFKNYALQLDDRELVKIDYLALDMGKHYAITGKSGCGKTSTLIDLKEGVSGALSSSGEISTNGSKVMFIDQKLYLPAESTLLESIYFPNVLKSLSASQLEALRAKVIELFKALEIDGFVNEPDNKDGLIARLDSKEFKLSGGQTKKIAVIQAILNQPDILIMDETFTGLDKRSLITVEELIKKHLPNVTILSVDHHAEDNNYNGFYDLEVNFANGMATQKQIASKYLEISEFKQEYADKCLLSSFEEMWLDYNDNCAFV